MRKLQIVIVAGGSGTRMGGGVPKQFIEIGGKPILAHTLNAFAEACPDAEIALVIPREYRDRWDFYLHTLPLCPSHRVAEAGATRFHSVQNGLALLAKDANALIAVHDGVRPFVSEEVILACFERAAADKTAVPVVEAIDSMREVLPIGSKSVDRSLYRLVQTPQVFDAELLRKAYLQDYIPRFTDDASVVEALGLRVSLVQGNRENIKITSPFDLMVAQAILSQKR